MALNKSGVLLIFTNLALVLSCFCLGKNHIQLNKLRVENQKLSNENIELGGNELLRLRKINTEIENIQAQIRNQLARNPENEVPDDPKAEDWAMDKRRQDAVEERDKEVKRLNNRVRELHNEFLCVRLPQIRLEVQIEEYQRHNEIMQAYLNEIINNEGEILRGAKIDIRRLRQNVEIKNEDLENTLQEINNRIDQELESREIH